MDLNGCPRSDLSLGLHGAPYAPIIEDSISFLNDPALREPPGSTTSLHLFDDQSKYARGSANTRTPTNVSDGADLKNGDDKEQEEEIGILGYTMFVKKRRRRGDSSSSSCSSSHPSKRPTKLESQPVAVQSWGNAPLSIADPNVFAIMEKEKLRQVRGIELVTSKNFVCRAMLCRDGTAQALVGRVGLACVPCHAWHAWAVLA